MKRDRYYILEGTHPKAVGMTEWIMSHNKQKRVSFTRIGEVDVSTVFLGMDHAYEGDPMLFETMIFGGRSDGYCDRCSTWDEAIEMHKKAVKLIEQ